MKCEESGGKAMHQEERLCSEMQYLFIYNIYHIHKYTYLGNRVSMDGECEAEITARTWCKWDELRACGELQ